MSDIIEKAETFSDTVVDAFNRGTQKGIKASNLFEQFGFTSNPFDNNILIAKPDLITDRIKSIINKLAERIGACYQSQKSLLLVSPEGVGRTSILKLLNATLNKGFDNNFSSYVHASSRWSGFSFKEAKEEHEDSNGDNRIDNFQKWMKEIDFSKTKIILIDDADAFIANASQYMSAVKFEHLQTPTMVFCTIPITQARITKTDLFNEMFGDIFWVMPLEKNDIKEILLKSIEAVKTNNSSPFEDSSIDKIADYSLGLPGEAGPFGLSMSKKCISNWN